MIDFKYDLLSVVVWNYKVHNWTLLSHGALNERIMRMFRRKFYLRYCWGHIL